MNEVIIRYEGNDVIIRGPREILKIVIDPSVEGIQRITGPEKPVVALPNTEEKKRKYITKKQKPLDDKKPRGRKPGKEITADIIKEIEYLRDEEKLTAKQIAGELKISLAAVNAYYQNQK